MLVNNRQLTRREQIQAIEYLTEAGTWDRQFLWATRNSETTKKQLNEVFFLLAGLAMLGSVFGALYLGKKFLDKYDFGGKGVKPEDQSSLKKSITDAMGKHKGLNEKAIKELRKKMEDMGLDKEQIDAIVGDLQKESGEQRKRNGKELGALNAWLAENPPEEKGWKTKFAKWVGKNMKSVGLQVGIGQETWTIDGEEDVSELKDRIPELRKEFINQGVKIPEDWAETLESFYEEIELPKLVTLQELEADAKSSSQVAEGAVIYRTGRRQFDLIMERVVSLVLEETQPMVMNSEPLEGQRRAPAQPDLESFLAPIGEELRQEINTEEIKGETEQEVVNVINQGLEGLENLENLEDLEATDEEEREAVYNKVYEEFTKAFPFQDEKHFAYDTVAYNTLINDIEGDDEYKPFVELLKLYGLRNISLGEKYKEKTKSAIEYIVAVNAWNEKVREAFGAKKKEQDEKSAAEEIKQEEAKLLAAALDPKNDDHDEESFFKKMTSMGGDLAGSTGEGIKKLIGITKKHYGSLAGAVFLATLGTELSGLAVVAAGSTFASAGAAIGAAVTIGIPAVITAIETAEGAAKVFDKDFDAYAILEEFDGEQSDKKRATAEQMVKLAGWIAEPSREDLDDWLKEYGNTGYANTPAEPFLSKIDKLDAQEQVEPMKKFLELAAETKDDNDGLTAAKWILAFEKHEGLDPKSKDDVARMRALCGSLLNKSNIFSEFGKKELLEKSSGNTSSGDSADGGGLTDDNLGEYKEKFKLFGTAVIQSKDETSKNWLKDNSAAYDGVVKANSTEEALEAYKTLFTTSPQTVKDLRDEAGLKLESPRSEDQLIFERWGRLAGLI